MEVRLPYTLPSICCHLLSIKFRFHRHSPHHRYRSPFIMAVPCCFRESPGVRSCMMLSARVGEGGYRVIVSKGIVYSPAPVSTYRIGHSGDGSTPSLSLLVPPLPSLGPRSLDCLLSVFLGVPAVPDIPLPLGLPGGDPSPPRLLHRLFLL